MRLEQIYYSGDRIDLSPHRGSWETLVYLPGPTLAEAPISHSLNAIKQNFLVLQEAQEILDAFMTKGNRK
jgi:hypothetical protein